MPVRPTSSSDSGRSRSRSSCRRATGAFTTLKTVPITSSNGYFDIKMKFPSSGNVQLAYTYPSGDPLLPVGIGGYHDRQPELRHQGALATQDREYSGRCRRQARPRS